MTFFQTVDAHVIRGERIEWVNEDLPKIEAYFKKPLDKELLIYSVKDRAAYYNELAARKIKNAKRLSYTSYAVTSSGNMILINTEGLSRQHFFFILAHEMTHQYQFEKYGKSILKNIPWMEQDADYHAYKITGYVK